MRRHSFFSSLVAVVVCFASSALAQSANAPIGNRDGITPSGSTFLTWGWTCDPDSWGSPIGIHFYVDGTYAAGQYAGYVTADTQRSDVAGVCNGTTAHGYGFYVPSQFLTTGTHTIYAYALDTSGLGPNTLLGGSPLSFTVSETTPAPSCGWASPQSATTLATSGTFDVFAYNVQNATSVLFPTWAHAGQGDIVWYPGTNLGGGTWRASIDLGRHFAGNPIYGTFNTHVYASNASYAYTACAATTFQRSQPPQATYSISGRTGTPGAVVNAGGISATSDGDGVYTISGLAPGTYSVGHGAAVGSCRIVPDTLTVSVGPSRTDANFATQCDRSWDPLIRNASRSLYRQTDENGGYAFWGSGAPAWVFSNYNEVPIPPSDLTHPVASLPNSLVDAFFTKQFESKGDGTYRVRLGMNKDSNPNGVDDNNVLLNLGGGSPLGSGQQVWLDTTYSTAFFEDNFDLNSSAGFPLPRLNEDLWIDVRAYFESHRVASEASQPQPQTSKGLPQGFPNVKGMSRLTVGVTVSWGVGAGRFLEIVLARDPGYDGCTPTGASWWGTFAGGACQDSSGLYDRRASWGDSAHGNQGELVYLYAPELGQVYSQIGLAGLAPVPQPLGIGGTNTYSLPIAALFKWYFGGGLAAAGGPTSWSNAEIHGVYIGLETWGRATTYVKIDNYRLYAVRR